MKADDHHIFYLKLIFVTILQTLIFLVRHLQPKLRNIILNNPKLELICAQRRTALTAAYRTSPPDKQVSPHLCGGAPRNKTAGEGEIVKSQQVGVSCRSAACVGISLMHE